MWLPMSFREGRLSMGATFRIRVRSEGTSRRKAYVGKDGTKFRNLMIGGIEESVLDLTGKMVACTGLAASERTLMLNAIYFQRIISRTPRDESYSYRDKEGHIRYHEGEKGTPNYQNDHIQDYWTARYWRYEPITAKYLRDSCGCTFEKFNDKKEIETIYKEFRNRFFGKEGSKGRANKEEGRTVLKSVRIECEYPDDQEHKLRYHLLEYGGYVGDGIIKEGEKYLHGVVGKRSIQAPSGMTALTKAEFDAERFDVPNDQILDKMPSLSKVIVDYKKVRKLLGGKRRLSKEDVAKVMEWYGV